MAKVAVPDALIDAFRAGRVILFVGSGLSSAAEGGYPDSVALARLLREQVVIDFEGRPRRLEDLIGGEEQGGRLGLDDVAEYFELFAGSHRLLQVIKTVFNNPTISATAAHQELWELPNIRQIYTTNFDPLIEDGLEMSRIRAEPRVITDPKAPWDVSAAEYHVFKLHGCAVRSEQREAFVITKSDYMDFEDRHPLSKLKAQSELVQNVFLFLGYGLNDPDFQSLYREVRRFAGPTAQGCFAAIRDVVPAKVAYWKKLGLHIVDAAAQDVIESIKSHVRLRLHTSWFEWRSKEGSREDIKQAIAQKALSALLAGGATAHTRGRRELALILDAGTSTLAFAKRLRDLFDRGSHLLSGVSSLGVATNCTAIADLLRWIHLPESRRRDTALPSFSLHLIGGRLRTETQALVPPVLARSRVDAQGATADIVAVTVREMAEARPVIAFMGATAATPEGFSTNTEQEVAAKRAMMNCAQRVIFLLDHSKFRVGGHHIFLSPREARRMITKEGKEVVIVTDRQPPEELTRPLLRSGIRLGLISEVSLWPQERRDVGK